MPTSPPARAASPVAAPVPPPAPRSYDVPLVVVTALLLAYGLTMVWSASAFVAQEETSDGYHFVTRQILAIVVGLVVGAVATATPYRRLQSYAPALYTLSLVFLCAVWIPGLGHSANGAQRWFGLAGIHFQPAELAKVAVLIGLATWLHKHRANIHHIQGVLLPAGVAILLPLVFIIVQPDFGSTAIIVLLCAGMLFFAGLRLSWFACLVGPLVGLLGIVMVAEPYRRARLLSFLDPFADCAGDGYQVCQSLLALHHGGLAGRGLGEGSAKLLYLPEPYNDFLAAVLGEELGLPGFVVLTTLYVVLAQRGFSIARRAPDLFGSLLASTFTVMLVGQAALNLGVVLSVVPNKGLVLPFMSYGASAMMMNIAAVGVLLSISAECRPADAKARAAGPVFT
ncbi:stage V sporulation protein E [Deltaproteobacteria bacterium]|nr:stage V sporulation protein E [Deltaproteobacteria bacterium]